jgi:hypothetical protein
MIMVDHIVSTIRKNAREELRIGLSDFNGYDLANIRVWFQADDGTMRPGNKGLAFKLAMLPEVIAALQQLETEARRRGLIGEGRS